MQSPNTCSSSGKMAAAVDSSAAGSNANPQPPKSKALISSYPTRFWTAIRRLLPSHGSSILFPRISNLYPRGSSAKSRRRKPGLPLPLPPKILKSRRDVGESSSVICILEDIFERVLSSLHAIQKNLQFWQSRAEGTDTQKLYFMFFERGPRAFIDETISLISRHRREGLSLDVLCDSAAATISERIDVLLTLQHCLARFLAQLYMEVDKCGELLTTDLDKSLPSLLATIDSLFSKLEESMSLLPEVCKSGNSLFTDGGNSPALMFVKFHETGHERSQWTDIEIANATNLIYQNLQRLDAFVSFLVSKYRKPTRLTLYWVHYTCGTVGLSICTIWLLRHSSLMGSSDIDNWIREAKESTTGFWRTHVEEPLLSIRDELFETFKRREKGVMEPEEVQLTADSLHRMLLAFAEQAQGQKLPEDLSDQTMMEIVMSRYEKELTHPISSLVSGGELVRALLIQVQKLKLDLEMAMLDLNKILKANEINFAILAALPAFFLFFLLLMFARALVQQLKGKGAEGRGRIARRQRRLLVGEVKLWIIKFQTCLDEGREEDAQRMYGLVLYCLDRLCKAVESHARETGEWLSLRQDIYEIASCGLKSDHKLQVISDVKDYDCMLSAYQRR